MYGVIDKVTPPDKRYLDLKFDQWDLLSQLLVVLKALQVATKALSLEQTVSLLIYPVNHGLINCHLKADTTDLPTIKRFKETVISQLENCFSFDPENIAILAAAVDPRYKDLDFMKSEEREEVKKILLEKIAMIEESCEAEMTTRSIREETEEPKKRRKTRRKQLCHFYWELLLTLHALQTKTSQERLTLNDLKENHSYTMMNVHYYGGDRTKSSFL